LTFTDFKCNSKGKLEQIDGKYIMSEIILEASVTILDIKDKEKAERILFKSEAACLISNSIKSKITLIPIINVA
jgi:organic hydroperoxide reductase OsmC/OhrA